MAGCSSMGSMESVASNSVVKDMAGKLFGQWNLSELGGKDISSMLPAGTKVPNLNFASDGKVAGFTGVNNLTSSVDPAALAKGDLKLAPAATTKMAGTPEANGLESQFLSALSNVTGYKIDGDTLSLKNGTDTLMKFIKPK